MDIISRKSVEKNTGREIAVNILVLIIATVAFLLVAEVGMRVLFQDTGKGIWPKDHARYVPGLKRNVYVNLTGFEQSTSEYSYTINTNQDGFRDFTPIEKGETSRIVAVGASTLFGNTVQQEETYLSQLGEKLDVEVVNLGLGGNGFDEMIYTLEEYGLRYEPDLVLYEVALGNFHSAHVFRNKGDTPSTSTSVLGWFYQNSRLANSAYWKIKTTPLGFKMVNALGLNRNAQDSNSFDLAILTHRNSSDVYESKKSAIRSIRETKVLLDKHDIPMVIIFIPPAYDINPDKLDKIVDAYGLEEGVLDVSAPQQFFKNVAERAGILFFDPTEDLKNSPYAKELDWQFDTHYNAHGNEIYAGLLATFIKEHQLVKS